MRRLVIIALASFTTLAAHAATIDIALTDDQIAVDTSFAGARLTLFGAITGLDDNNTTDNIDIVLAVRGPATQFQVRQIEKNNLIWTPGQPHRVTDAPGLYLTYSTQPVGDIVPLPLQAEHNLDADFLDFNVASGPADTIDPARALLFRNAFLTEAEELGLYGAHTDGISFKSDALFTINVDLPANTPVGDYKAAVYLLRDGALLGVDEASLAVNRVGMERRIYQFAHQRPISYGVFCVALSLFAGWMASLAFRK